MEIKFTPPDYLLVFIILGIVLNYVFPIKKLITSPYIYIGWVLILLGIVLNCLVWWDFRKAKNSMKPDEKPKILITSGVFKISRNPIYLGMALILLGEAVLLGSLVTFIIPILFVILINRTTIPIEEKILEKSFGGRYLNYRRKVRRWI